MHPLPLVVFLTLAAGPSSDRTIPTGCREDYDTCREDCTIDYGGSTTKYRQLTQCIQHCDKERQECTTRHYSLRDSSFDQPSEGHDATAPASGTRSPPSDGVRRGVYRASDAEPPASAEPPEEQETKEVKEPAPPPPPPTEAPQKKEPVAAPEPAPKPQPAAPSKPPAPQPAAAKGEEMRVFDEPEAEPEPAPAPKPAPKPVEPLRPKPPPEPKKKDISDWDPNGN